MPQHVPRVVVLSTSQFDQHIQNPRLTGPRQLLHHGMQVVITSRDDPTALQAAHELAREGGQASGIGLDITKPTQVANVFERSSAENHEKIAVLVNNAGIAIDGPAHRPSLPDSEIIKKRLQANLIGAWNCCAAAIPAMRAAGYGRIVNLSSTMASLSLANTAESPAYRIAKASLNMLTRVLAAELAATGILVNAASPGARKLT